MFKVTVMTPNTPGKKFDFEYYLNTHMPMVKQRLGPEGLVRTEEAKGNQRARARLPGPISCYRRAFLRVFRRSPQRVHEARPRADGGHTKLH